MCPGVREPCEPRPAEADNKNLRGENGFSSRAIERQTNDSKTTVVEFLKRFKECEKLSWPLPDDVTNEYIESLLYKKKGNTANDSFYRSFNEEEVHRKLAKRVKRCYTCGNSTMPKVKSTENVL